MTRVSPCCSSLDPMPGKDPAPAIIPLAATDRPAAVRAIERFFVAQRNRLVWVHLVMFVLFTGLIFGPAFLPAPPEDATIFSHVTPLANFILWGLWFPLVFVSVIFTGRSWCGLLCPMGAASEWVNKHGFKRAIPAWVRWPGTPVISFLLVTIWGQTVGVRDHAQAIALVFGSTLAAAVLLGLFFGRNKRAWCRHMCPIGLLLGVFSRLGAVQFAPKHKQPGGDRWTERGPCPTMIDLARKEESRHCIECFRCVNPHAKGGLALTLRRPGREIETIADHHPDRTEVWFFFLGTGAALGGFLWLVLPIFQTWRQAVGEWAIERDWYWIGLPGPGWLMSVHPAQREVFRWLDFFMISGFMLGFTAVFALLLAGLTAAGAVLSGRLGGAGDFKARFVELGYQFAPVAMISLIIGLGGKLFDGLGWLGLGAAGIGLTKGALFVAALGWSLWLGGAILRRQGVTGWRRLGPLAPGVLGSCLVGLAWWPAIFGL